MKLTSVIIVLMLMCRPSCAISQKDTSFRKHLFQLKVSNGLLLSNTGSFHHESFPLHVHDYYRNYTIDEQSHFVNPDISVGYSRRIGGVYSHQNRTSSVLYLTFDLGWRSYTYKNKKTGYQYGGMSGGLFSGTIDQKNILQYLTFRPGFQAYFSNYRKNIFGIGIGLAWSRLFYSKNKSFLINELTGEQWTMTSKLDARLYPYPVTNSKEKYLPRYDHFILDVNISVGKLINNYLAGFFIRYSITEYTLFDKPYMFTFDSSFLRNFHVIHVGMHADLACLVKLKQNEIPMGHSSR